MYVNDLALDQERWHHKKCVENTWHVKNMACLGLRSIKTIETLTKSMLMCYHRYDDSVILPTFRPWLSHATFCVLKKVCYCFVSTPYGFYTYYITTPF